MIPKPNWKVMSDGVTYYDDSDAVMNAASMRHIPTVFREGVEHGAMHLAKHLIEVGRDSSEDMFRLMIAIADGKSVTSDWNA